MTATELRRMPSEQKKGLFFDIPVSVSSGPINSEKDPINVVIEQYANTKIPVDDIPTLKKNYRK